jgi:transposase-like protein
MARLDYSISGLARELGCSRTTLHKALNGGLLHEPWRSKALALGFTEQELAPSPLIDAAHELAERSRAEQGLPSFIEDPAILRAVATILAHAIVAAEPKAKR